MQALNPDKLKQGQRVLIQAGTGGVGHVAIQLAKQAGVYVITTTSERNVAFAKARFICCKTLVTYKSRGTVRTCIAKSWPYATSAVLSRPRIPL